MSRIESTRPVVSRRAFLGGMAIGLTAASPAFAAAPAILKNAGNFRALNLVNGHTAERLNCVYWIDGKYVPEALEAFNYILRDWREDLIKPIDPKTLDIIAATHGLLGCGEPFHIVSGYRSAEDERHAARAQPGRGQELVSPQGHGDRHHQPRRARSTRSPRRRDRWAAGGVGRYTGRTSSMWTAAPSASGAAEQGVPQG